MLDIPVVGFANAVPTEALKLKPSGKVVADYQMVAGKRLHCTNRAREYRARLNAQTLLVVRLYDDGIAMRYELSGLTGQSLPQEQTSYRIPEGMQRWMMRWSSGYEDFYLPSTTAHGPNAPKNHRWAFPALLEPVDDVFLLLSEANIERGQSAASLTNEGDLFRVTPDQNPVQPTGSWHTPWRLAIIGSLADVVESTLVTDVSEPSRLAETDWIQPGVVSWIYWAYNHGSNDYNIIRRYIDFAATLRLPYVLIEAEWDEMKDGKTIEDALSYAREKGVRSMIWYNSTTDWINGAPGPKFRLNKPEDREREFAWCERMGVAGVKIDFFAGDGQPTMDYCIDLLESAARHHLLVNFHGATIPRGWQRTYPHLLSTEGVYGAEWYNNVPTFTSRAAAHNATLPFTRNVIGPMDYTPCAFSDSQHPHITSRSHELALTVLYESGLQHLADRPESFLAQPSAVRDFLSALPAAWDETRLLAGRPADYVVMARRKGNTWYVAAINGKDEARDIALPSLFEKAVPGSVTFFADDASGEWSITSPSSLPVSVHCQPRGGFVAVVRI